MSGSVRPTDWFLDAAERGNPATVLDDRHPGSRAWSLGNRVEPLVHGATYFATLARAVGRMRRGDLLMFVDWRGDPDQRLGDDDTAELNRVLADAARRGVDVHGLVWRSHWDKLSFSASENRTLGEEINRAGGCCVLDMRVRTGGSHHQKFVVLRHRDRPGLDVAFVGGIDLCHSRRDDRDHAGDPQRQPMAAVYGDRPPWHDVQLQLTGPVVADVETVFRERWDDPQPLSRSPLRIIADRLHGDSGRRPLPAPLPPPAATGPHAVQLLRTYARRAGGYPFAPAGERSVARGFLKALGQARRLIYLEDQYLWSADIGRRIASALRTRPGLHLIAVVPHHPDQDGAVSLPPNLLGRYLSLSRIRAAAPGRVAVYGVENHTGTPVYVHAKVCIIDDRWACVGSDNLNRRSWTHDSELAAAVWDTTPTDDGHSVYARTLRQELASEHLDRATQETDAATVFAEFTASADALQRWHETGAGPRPPGRLRPLSDPSLSRATRAWSTPLYRAVYDPDGRRPIDRVRRRY